jgi:uncharacterized protein YndB with AHSA1/START domain
MMPVKKDASGRRYVKAEVEVPGSPEDVWQAIATGPGISAWFVPTEIEQVDGVPTKVIAHFGPGMDSVADVTVWDPPRRFAADSRDDMGPNDPTIATEWTVEARSGGTCIVRVVHSWFTSSDKWDDQFAGHEQGWVAFFRILTLYLKHFSGEPSSGVQAMAMAPPPVSTAWHTLTGPLGLANAAEGQRFSSPAGVPRLAGIVERAGPQEYPELLLRLQEPTRGLAHLFAMEMGGSVCVPVRLYLYGNDAKAIAGREENVWQAWIGELFPPASDATPVGQEAR